jgi:hypothetical protein
LGLTLERNGNNDFFKIKSRKLLDKNYKEIMNDIITPTAEYEEFFKDGRDPGLDGR